MATPDELGKAFARQAAADFSAWELYIEHPKAVAAQCHRLLFLQMACEKLCKAHLLRAGMKLADVEKSHGVVKKHLPIVLRAEIGYWEKTLRRFRDLKGKINRLAGEIEVLNPSIDRAGQRRDNCEYPWAVGDKIVSPLDHEFAPLRLLADPTAGGTTILKFLRLAIDRSIDEPFRNAPSPLR